MNNIMVTGANGFIGYHVTNTLLNSGYNVYAPVRPSACNQNLVKALERKGLNIYQGSFYDPKLLDMVFKNNINSVIHLAAIRGQQKFDSDEYNSINISGTTSLLDYCKQSGDCNFLYFSTVGVVGTIPENQPASIHLPVRPDTDYHRTKWESEKLVRQFHSKKLRTLVLRPTITYGRYDDGFFPKLVDLVSRRRFVTSSKPVLIHLLNVESIAEFIPQILKNSYFDGQSYIVADKGPVTLQQLADKIYNIFYGKPYPAYYKLPDWIFKTGESMSRLYGNFGLSTSIQLISKSWVFDIQDTIENLRYKPECTLECISKTIMDIFNAN